MVYDPGPWPFILTFANLWKNVGYSTVLYLAAITGIDTNQYEAAAIDGATKWQQVLHVTIPHLRTMIAILFIMNVGKIFASDFGLFYNVPMQNGALFSVTQTIDTYVYRAYMATGDPGTVFRGRIAAKCAWLRLHPDGQRNRKEDRFRKQPVLRGYSKWLKRRKTSV